jgi:hypothetical protein
MRFEELEVREFLDHSMIMRMGSLSPKGQPLIRCLWFVLLKGRIYIFVTELSPTGCGISVHPNVTLLFDGERGAASGRVLRVRGRAAYRRDRGTVVRVLSRLARKYLLTPPGLRNLLAHARIAPLALRFYAEPGWRERGKGLGLIMEVEPKACEFLPSRPGQAA